MVFWKKKKNLVVNRTSLKVASSLWVNSGKNCLPQSLCDICGRSEAEQCYYVSVWLWWHWYFLTRQKVAVLAKYTEGVLEQKASSLLDFIFNLQQNCQQPSRSWQKQFFCELFSCRCCQQKQLNLAKNTNRSPLSFDGLVQSNKLHWTLENWKCDAEQIFARWKLEVAGPFCCSLLL